MAYTSNRKPNALNAASSVAAGNEIVVSQAGVVNKATMTQVENFIFSAKTATSAPTGTEVTVIRLTDGNLRQVALSDIVPAGNITNAKISATAAIADTKLATISTAGKVLNSATTATSANTNNAIVARDGSGNFSAGTITATLAGSATGNAATATNLSSNRTFALTGNVTGSTSSNLSSGVSIATTIPTGTVTSAMIADGTIVDADINASAAIADTKLATINTAGKVTNNAVQAVSTNTANRIVTRDASGNFAAGTVTAALTGNASTATTLATGRTIALTGDVTGTTGTFNGSANVSAATTLANSGVSAGTYNNNAAQVSPFTVDAKGRVTNVGTAVPIALDYSVISGTPYKNNVRAATTTNLTATYANGSSGVGATLTNSGTLGTLPNLDGTGTAALNTRVLVKDQTNAAHNGIYVITDIGSSTTAWVLTRATDADQNTEIGGAVVTVDRGTVNGGKFFTTDFRSNNTVGTTAQNWSQVVTTGDTATVSEAMLVNANVTTAKIADLNVTTAKIADGSVTLAKLVTAVQQSLLPAGAVQAFAMNSAPAGWLAANGAAVSRSTYAALFSAIGTTYGAGNGSTTFNLPDLRGYFVRGSGTNSDGTAAGTFGAKQGFATSAQGLNVSPANHNHSYTDQTNFNTLGGVGGGNANTGTQTLTKNTSSTSLSIISSATETRPANIALLYCIKF
jgi:microcystin-dependent protein